MWPPLSHLGWLTGRARGMKFLGEGKVGNAKVFPQSRRLPSTGEGREGSCSWLGELQTNDLAHTATHCPRTTRASLVWDSTNTRYIDAQRWLSASSPPTPITLVWWVIFALTLLKFRKSCYSKALARMPKHQLLIVAVTLRELSLELPLTLTLSNDLGRPCSQSFWFWNSKCSKHGIYQRWSWRKLTGSMAIVSIHKSGLKAPGFGVGHSGCSSQASVSVLSVLPWAGYCVPLC